MVDATSTANSGIADAGENLHVRRRASGRQNLQRYLDIVLFKSYADLQAERQRTYLGFLWWIFEPLMYMAVMWLVFSHVLARGTEDYPVFLLTGLVFWQWFKSCVSHGSVAVLQASPLIQLVPLPPVLFPLINVLTDSFKFLFILTLLLAALLVTGHAQSPTVLALPLILVAELAVICAFTIWISALIPFVPDLRFVTENVLIAMMFLSGIFYDVSVLPVSVQEYFFLNPVAFLIREARNSMMYQQWPDLAGLAVVTAGAIFVCALGAVALDKLRRFYPKLPR
jgi:lipopolysaccharide transport system permease protein